MTAVVTSATPGIGNGTVDVVGSAAVNAKVQVMVDGVAKATVFSDGSGVWSASLSGLPGGQVSITACEIISASLPGLPITVRYAAPIMPPSYTNWNGANEAFGYLGNMLVEANAANGTKIGRVLVVNDARPAPTYTISGDVAGLAINSSTGMISVADGSQLLAATRTITITATNPYGSASTTVQLPVVSVTANVWYVDAANGSDANAGNLPSLALKTASAARPKQGTVYWKRGGTWTDDSIALRTNGVHAAYGDPADAAPWINSPNVYGAAPVIVGGNYSTSVINTSVSDLKISGTERCFYHNGDGTTNGTNAVKIIRCTFTGNTSTADSAKGVYLKSLTHGAVTIRHCRVENYNGDGVYLVKCGSASGEYLNEIAYNFIDSPIGSGADCLQIANENDISIKSYDFWVHHNTMKNASANSQKGNAVLENTYRTLFEENDCEGRHFCLSSIGFNATVRYNRLTKSDLANDAAALVVGESNNFGKQRWVGNLLENNWVALGILGYNDPAGGWNRYDMEIFFNTSRNNLRHYRQNRPASGRLQYNVGELNTNNAMVADAGNGQNIATGGDYTTYTMTPNYINSAAGPAISTPSISGIVQVGQTVSMPTGYDGYFWCINDVPVDGAMSRTFVVPNGNPDNLNVPVTMKSARLSAFAIKTDASGNTSVAPATFADGSKTSVISP